MPKTRIAQFIFAAFGFGIGGNLSHAVSTVSYFQGLDGTHNTKTVNGAVQPKAMMLMMRPQRPSVKRSRGIGFPKNRLQISAARQMLYEKVMAMIVRETMALKPTTGPKLMSEMTQVKPMTTQTARRGTSKS